MKTHLLPASLMVLFSVHLMSCFEEDDNSGPVHPKYFSRMINEAVSPQKNRVIKTYELGNSNDSLTQVTVGFGWPQEYGRGGVFAAKGTNLGIIVNWNDEDNITITYKPGLKILPSTVVNNQIHLFNEKVTVHYSLLKN
jgi:hypothetical protein